MILETLVLHASDFIEWVDASGAQGGARRPVPAQGLTNRQDNPPADLEQIIDRSSRLLDVRMDAAGGAEIARRSRGTPRIANRLLRRVRDYAEVKATGRITKSVTEEALKMLEVDPMGFDKMDTMLLLTLIDKFAGGPVGVETLAAAIGEEKDTIEDVYEPFLIQEGYLARTPKGRVATPSAYEHFGRVPGRSANQGKLF